MKEIEQYANDLIEKYYLLFSNSVSHITMDRAIRCAIVDVNNTIEAFTKARITGSYREYYKEVLTILKGKL